MSDLEKLCKMLGAAADDAAKWASWLDQESMRTHSYIQQLSAAVKHSNRPEGRQAIASLNAAQHKVREASRLMQQVSAASRKWIAVTVAASRGGGDYGGYGGATGAPALQSMTQISGWLSEINPRYDADPGSPFSTNCGKCAAAVFRRLEGDTDARAAIGTLSTAEMNQVTGKMQTPMSPGQIRDYLISRGAGAHAVIGIDYDTPPGETPCGHWFNAYYDGQNVYAIDGQTGRITDWPPDYGPVRLWDISA